MKTLYEAANAVEAHMITHLLAQSRIAGHVQGEFLQGAVGELPAAGLVRVLVATEDYEQARAIVDEWNAALPAEPEAPAASPVRSGRSDALRLGGCALLAVLATSLFFGAQLRSDGMDYNSDGIVDDKWVFAPSGRALRNEADRNLDGKADYIARYGRRGFVETAEADEDFDGVFETRYTFRNGTLSEALIDTDGDAYPDLRSRYQHGVLSATAYINPASGRPLKTEYFKIGRITHAELDTDGDGRPDVRVRYDAIGEEAARTRLD